MVASAAAWATQARGAGQGVIAREAAFAVRMECIGRERGMPRRAARYRVQPCETAGNIPSHLASTAAESCGKSLTSGLAAPAGDSQARAGFAASLA